jgi:hypothetical protein
MTNVQAGVVFLCFTIGTGLSYFTWQGYRSGWCPKWLNVLAQAFGTVADVTMLVTIVLSQRVFGIWLNVPGAVLAVIATITTFCAVTDVMSCRKAIKAKSTKERDAEADKKFENLDLPGM